MLETLTTQLVAARHLLVEQVRRAVESLTDEIIAAQASAEFLIALATKGGTPAEIAAFAAALRKIFESHTDLI